MLWLANSEAFLRTKYSTGFELSGRLVTLSKEEGRNQSHVYNWRQLPNLGDGCGQSNNKASQDLESGCRGQRVGVNTW